LLDQSEHSSRALLQLFDAMQERHLGLIRAELGQLRRLGEQLADLRDELAALSSRAEPPRPALEGRPDAPPPARPAVAGPPAAATGQEVASWLLERIGAIQGEQETVWKRLSGMVLGR
jgi:hypothetical protein